MENEVWDFYYSKEAYNYWKKLNRNSEIHNETVGFVKGIAFTEMISSGLKPLGNFNDAIMV